MKPVMTVMGSLLLAGNLLFAVPVRQNIVLIRNAEQSEQDIRKAVSELLEQKGLEAISAGHLVTEHFGMNGLVLARAVTHLRLLFPELEGEALLQELANQVLRREPAAFDDYDYLAGMLHRLIGVDLSPAYYERMQHCVMLNRTLLRS